jgi:DNA-binding LacI/PurR family transcriptional regulator
MSTEPSMSRAPNIRDVAREAGVSYQTVSRVLNDSTSLRPQTRDRVLEVIDRLGYRPNQAARALVSSKSHVIGILVVTRAAAYGVQTIIYEVEDAARAAGYTIAMATTLSDDRSVRRALGLLEGKAVEAIVVVAAERTMFELLASFTFRVPYVMLDSQHRDHNHSVAIDQFEGGRMATRHLLDLGHRRIAHVSGPPDWVEADARMQGWLCELEAHGVEPLPVINGDWTAETGYRAGLELRERRDVTAVFCSNDLMALGLMHAYFEAGMRVPDDVSVVGFDDIPEASHFWPPLTTVRQDFAELGRRSVGLLLAGLAGLETETLAELDPIAPSLVERASTAPRVLLVE